MAVMRPVAWLSALRASELVHISVSAAAEFSRYSALRRSYSIVLSGLGQVEQASRPAMGIRRDAIVVVSNLYAYKRIDEVLAAFAAEPSLHDSYELVIAGDELEAGLRRRLEDLASVLGCAKNVRFAGFLEKAELVDLYSRAAVLVSASREEAFPLPPGEALAMAIPVVLSDIPPHRELYGRWARLVTPGDVAGLSQAMLAAVDRGCVPDDQVEELKAAFSWARNGQALARILRLDAVTDQVPAKRKLRAVQLAALPLAVRTIVGRAASSAGSFRTVCPNHTEAELVRGGHEVLAIDALSERAKYCERVRRRWHPPAALGLALNIGTGGKDLVGWVDLDETKPGDEAASQVPPVPFRDDCSDEILAGHVVEHMALDDGRA